MGHHYCYYIQRDQTSTFAFIKICQRETYICIPCWNETVPEPGIFQGCQNFVHVIAPTHVIRPFHFVNDLIGER
jgi:hypothetical protein